MATGKHKEKQSRKRKGWIATACIAGLAAVALLATFAYLGLQGTTASLETNASSNTVEQEPRATDAAPPINDTPINEAAIEQTKKQAQLANTSSQTAGENSSSKAASSATAGAQSPPTQTGDRATSTSTETEKDYSTHLDAQAIIKGIPTDSQACTFSLVDKKETPTLPADDAAALNNAAKVIEDAGFECSAVLIDVQSGCGIAYNAGDEIYTASSFKAPFADYVLERKLTHEWDYSTIEAAILYSDNEAYETLAREFYLEEEYKNWLGENGITYDGWSPWYPHASATSMAACWTDIFHYIQTDEADAAWFKDLLANTNLSFIRNALEEEDVQVWNKGGWLADPEYNAVADCGIVETQGRNYLLCVLTSQPSAGEAQSRVYNVIRALWACREHLE